MSWSLMLLFALALVLFPLPSVADARSCAPQKLTFKRTPGAAAGTLSWRAPERLRRGARYRVWRNGKVVGQTRRRSIRLRVPVNRRFRLRVRPVTHRGRLTGCASELRLRIPCRLPRQPRNRSGLIHKGGLLAPAAPALYVDRASIGGRCSDSRRAAHVSITSPWCSLTTAVREAPGGSTVYVREGAYPILTLRAYAPSSMVTFRGYGSEHPTMPGMSIGISSSRSGNFSFQGFRFTNVVTLTNFDTIDFSHNEIALSPAPPTACDNITETCNVHTPSGLILTPPGANFIFNQNYVHGGNNGIVTLQPGAVSPFANFKITNNEFSGMGGAVMHVNHASNWTIRHNEFTNNGRFSNIDPYAHPDAIHVVGAADNLLVDSNYVYSVTGGRGFLFQPTKGDGLNCRPECLYQEHVTVQNNVIVGTTGDFALRITDATPGMTIINNTFWMGSVQRGVGLDINARYTETTGLVVENNVLNHFEADAGSHPLTFASEDHNLIADHRVGAGFIPPSGPNNIVTRPRFADLTSPAWDARLLAGSPGIDAADAAVAPSHDANGCPRAGVPEMGAYEYGSSSN